MNSMNYTFGVMLSCFVAFENKHSVDLSEQVDNSTELPIYDAAPMRMSGQGESQCQAVQKNNLIGHNWNIS